MVISSQTKNNIKPIDVLWIIEDDPISSFIATKMLEWEKVAKKLVSFENGEQALDALYDLSLAGKNAPDVILLDLNMPVMNGWEFLQELAKVPLDISHTKTFVYTVSVDIQEKEKVNYSSIPIAGYLNKPLDKSQIQLMLEEPMPVYS